MKTRQSLAYRFFTTITTLDDIIITLNIVMETANNEDLSKNKTINLPLAHSFAGDKK
jgi:hypothetical protein